MNIDFIFVSQAGQLYFRGQRIWLAAMEDLMSKGMRHATQVCVLSILKKFSCIFSYFCVTYIHVIFVV